MSVNRKLAIDAWTHQQCVNIPLGEFGTAGNVYIHESNNCFKLWVFNPSNSINPTCTISYHVTSEIIMTTAILQLVHWHIQLIH